MSVLSSTRHSALAAARWVKPVLGYSITTGFGAKGRLWSSGAHTGVDFACPTGTAVRAVAAGRIISAGQAGAYGNRIRIVHRPGLETWYCHLSKFEQTSGAVAAGDVIAQSGETGNVTGPHLHFEVRRDGIAVNPVPYLNGSVDGPSSPAAPNGAQAAGEKTNSAINKSASVGYVTNEVGVIGVELRRFAIVMATVVGGSRSDRRRRSPGHEELIANDVARTVLGISSSHRPPGSGQ